MTLSLPPNYVPLPIEVIEQAYRPDKPHRVLFASFVRLLALAWQNKYERTPRLREDELYNTALPDGSTRFGYLKLSRREYFTQKREMELLGWLRSTRPATGFVQFTFNRAVPVPESDPDAGAENRTEVQKTAPLKRIEEDSIDLKDSNLNPESSSSSETPVRKTAQTDSEKQMQLLVEHLRLVFDPDEYGLLEWRQIFLAGIPDRVLAWIAKAYQDRKRLASPIGLIVKHITLQDAPDAYFMEHAREILPEAYLEAIGEAEYACGYCQQICRTRDELRRHEAQQHPHRCTECEIDLPTADAWQAHFDQVHAPDPVFVIQADESVTVPIDGGRTAEQAWQSVLDQLQMEMPRASFDAWVRDTKACRYDGNAMQIGVRNAYTRDWLESRLESTVRRLLVGILNRSVEVVFVVVETA